MASRPREYPTGGWPYSFRKEKATCGSIPHVASNCTLMRRPHGCERKLTSMCEPAIRNSRHNNCSVVLSRYACSCSSSAPLFLVCAQQYSSRLETSSTKLIFISSLINFSRDFRAGGRDCRGLPTQSGVPWRGPLQPPAESSAGGFAENHVKSALPIILCGAAARLQTGLFSPLHPRLLRQTTAVPMHIDNHKSIAAKTTGTFRRQ